MHLEEGTHLNIACLLFISVEFDVSVAPCPKTVVSPITSMYASS